MDKGVNTHQAIVWEGVSGLEVRGVVKRLLVAGEKKSIRWPRSNLNRKGIRGALEMVSAEKHKLVVLVSMWGRGGSIYERQQNPVIQGGAEAGRVKI